MLLDCNSVISKPHYSKSYSTDSPVGPFVGSDGHIVRVVNRTGNTCRQARVHWLLANLVEFNKEFQYEYVASTFSRGLCDLVPVFGRHQAHAKSAICGGGEKFLPRLSRSLMEVSNCGRVGL